MSLQRARDRAKQRRQLTETAIRLATQGRWEDAIAVNRELIVPLARRTHATDSASDLSAAVGRFHELHRQRFGHANPAAPTEVVNVRLRMIGVTDKPVFTERPQRKIDPATGRIGRRPAIFGEPVPTDLYTREQLEPGQDLRDPAVIFQLDATTVIPPGWIGLVDGFENVLLTPG